MHLDAVCPEGTGLLARLLGRHLLPDAGMALRTEPSAVRSVAGGPLGLGLATIALRPVVLKASPEAGTSP